MGGYASRESPLCNYTAVVRQAGTWDLGPFAAVPAPGQKGLKITACMHNWGKFWTTRYKKGQKNPTATSEEPGAKAGSCAGPLRSTPPKGRADHLSHPSCLTPGRTPALTPCKEPAAPCLRE